MQSKRSFKGFNGIGVDEFLQMFLEAFKEFIKNSNNRPFKIFLITNSTDFDNINNTFLSLLKVFNDDNAPKLNLVQDNQINREKKDEKKDVAIATGPPATVEEDNNCVICMDKIEDEKKLDKCGHAFCKGCIESYFKSGKQTCPICGTVYGITMGTQPRGTMNVSRLQNRLPGYENCGCLQIVYSIPNGIQGVSIQIIKDFRKQ